MFHVALRRGVHDAAVALRYMLMRDAAAAMTPRMAAAPCAAPPCRRRTVVACQPMLLTLFHVMLRCNVPHARRARSVCRCGAYAAQRR